MIFGKGNRELVLVFVEFVYWNFVIFLMNLILKFVFYISDFFCLMGLIKKFNDFFINFWDKMKKCM